MKTEVLCHCALQDKVDVRDVIQESYKQFWTISNRDIDRLRLQFRLLVVQVSAKLIMKNFNRHSSHGHHGQSATNCYNHIVPKCQLSYYRIWNQIFILKVPEERGSKLECLEKTPDGLPANRYHILEEEIQRPGWESNPHPLTLVISSPGPERAPHLTH